MISLWSWPSWMQNYYEYLRLRIKVEPRLLRRLDGQGFLDEAVVNENNDP